MECTRWRGTGYASWRGLVALSANDARGGADARTERDVTVVGRDANTSSPHLARSVPVAMPAPRMPGPGHPSTGLHKTAPAHRLNPKLIPRRPLRSPMHRSQDPTPPVASGTRRGYDISQSGGRGSATRSQAFQLKALTGHLMHSAAEAFAWRRVASAHGPRGGHR